MQKKNRCRVIVCVSCCWFLPRDAVPASADTTYVCPSVTSRSSIEMAERIVMVLGMGAFSTSVDSRRTTLCSSAQSAHSSTLKRCITKIHVSTKIRVFSFGTLPHTLDFKKFHHYRSIVEMCYQLSLTQVNDQSVIDWTVVDQQSWQLYPRVPTVDRQVIVKLCLQHDSIARVYQGQLTTPARHGKSLSCQAV